jgi:hypothetical protein
MRGKNSPRQKLSHVAQNVKQHRVRELAGKCILLARMIRRKKPRQVSRQLVTSPMPKGKGSQRRNQRALLQQSQISPQRNATKHQYRARLKYLKLALQKVPAIRQFRRQRLVRRRRAAQSRGHVSILQRQTISAIRRSRLIGKSRAIERLVKEIAGPIASEHPSRAIRAMRRGRKSQYQKLRARIAEPWNRLAPIIPSEERASLVPRHLFAIPYQSRARATVNDFLIQLFQFAQASVPLESYHEPSQASQASNARWTETRRHDNRDRVNQKCC